MILDMEKQDFCSYIQDMNAGSNFATISAVILGGNNSDSQCLCDGIEHAAIHNLSAPCLSTVIKFCIWECLHNSINSDVVILVFVHQRSLAVYCFV